MQSPASDPSPAPITDGSRRSIGGDPAARLARTGVRVLAIGASAALVGAIIVAVLAISDDDDAVTAASAILVVVAVLLGALAGYLFAALRAHGGTGSTSPAVRPAETGLRAHGADGGEVVSDDEIASARALFGEGAGPARIDPSWPR
ncbi:hypothetical protein [Labedella endophytica]|uniref:Uncharacterized protein n=1 Tax=Labedella endophytica TaxID=1523160 RepID=A0A433JP52_9MICO|nr:hypothetical protein [Labedella endophytica]RUQ98245.1 hypothetical protein ELQ94_14635 [Labedella endophytica]